jgi:hypothetical protein
MYYTSAEQAAMDRDARNMKAAGVPLSGELETLRETLTSGNLNITSNAWDVDSLALGGGAFSLNADTTSGLTLGLYGGRLNVLNGIVTVAATTLTLSPSTTNYVQVSPAGVVSSNTAGFTAGYVPLYTVVTGVSAIAVTTMSKAMLACPPNGGIPGAMLSTAAATKGSSLLIPSITATTTVPIAMAPGAAATLTKLLISVTGGIATSGTNYWAFSLVEAGPAGTGTTAMLATGGGVNSTNATGGAALVANVAQALTLNATSANLVTAPYDLLLFTATATGAPTALTNLLIRAEFANAL